MSIGERRGAVSRVVLVGPTRSGTSLVQRLLCEHAGLTTFPETHLFVAGFLRRLSGWSVDAPALRSSLQCVAGIVDDAAVPVLGDDVSSTDAAALLIDWFDRIAAARRASGWLEKTPSHFRRLGLIRRAIGPSGIVVHVVRRPRECVASRVRASAEWGRPRGWLHSSAHWLAAFATMQMGRWRFGDQSISFEWVLRDPDRTIELVASAAGLAPAYGGVRRNVGAEMALGEEVWRHRSLEPPAAEPGGGRPDPPQRWVRLLLGALDVLWDLTYARPLERAVGVPPTTPGSVRTPRRATCVVVSAHEPSAPYGRPRVLRAHLTSLRRLGHEVVVIGAGGDARHRWRPRSLRSAWGLLEWAVVGRRPLSAVLTLTGRDERRTRRLLRDLHPEVIVADGVRVLGAIPEELKARTVVDLDDLMSDRYARAARGETDVAWVSRSVPVLGPLSSFVGARAGRWALGREACILRSAEARVVREYAATVLCSPVEAGMLEARTGVRPHVLGPGFDVAPAPPESMAVEATFLLVGRWTYPPNREAFDWLVEEVLPRTTSRYTVHVVGEGLDLVAATRWRGRVAVHGHLDDLGDAYASSWAGLCPVREPGGVKVKAVEALAHGRACIATSAAAAGLLGGDRGVVVCDDAAQFAAAIDRLARDRELAAGLAGDAAEHAARHYAEESLMARWRSVLARLDGSGGGVRWGEATRSYGREQ